MRILHSNDFETLEKARRLILSVENEFQMGSGKAGYLLSIIYAEGSTFIPDDVKKAIGSSDKKAFAFLERSFDLLMKSAEAGDGECMHLVAVYYQEGIACVNQDTLQCINWNEKALHAGYEGAVDDLIAIYGNPNSNFYNKEKVFELRKRLEG